MFTPHRGKTTRRTLGEIFSTILGKNKISHHFTRLLNPARVHFHCVGSWIRSQFSQSRIFAYNNQAAWVGDNASVAAEGMPSLNGFSISTTADIAMKT